MFYQVDKYLLNLKNNVDLLFIDLTRPAVSICHDDNPLTLTIRGGVNHKQLLSEITKIAHDFGLTTITTNDQKTYFIKLDNIYSITDNRITLHKTLLISLLDKLKSIDNVSNGTKIMAQIIANQEKTIINNDLEKNQNNNDTTNNTKKPTKKPKI